MRMPGNGRGTGSVPAKRDDYNLQSEQFRMGENVIAKKKINREEKYRTEIRSRKSVSDKQTKVSDKF